MVTQALLLWGKRSLRREAALAELDAARGREQATRDAFDECIKIAFPNISANPSKKAIGRGPLIAMIRLML
jgi:hypothetical protein